MAPVQLVAGQNLNRSLLKHPFMAKTWRSFFRTGLGEVYLRFWSWLARQLAAISWRKGNKLIEISGHQELSQCQISQAALRNVLKWSGLTLQNSGRETQWKGSLRLICLMLQGTGRSGSRSCLGTLHTAASRLYSFLWHWKLPCSLQRRQPSTTRRNIMNVFKRRKTRRKV